MLIDDITITVRAGNGGKGAVAFNKNLNQYGPTGASGGKGGSVYFRGSSDLSALQSYRYKKVFAAENGKDGRAQFRDGVDAEDLVLSVPVGTVIHNLSAGTDREVVAIDEQILAARGGKGGRGNFHFRSSTNTRPKEFEYGKPGEYLGVGATILLAYIAWEQLSNLAETSSAQFLLELKEDLFTAETRTLFHLFELKWLTFHETDEKNIAWFEVNTQAIENSSLPKEIKNKLTERKIFSTYGIDDWVLGPLEDVGLLLKRKILSIAVIYEEFSTFYGLTLANEAVQKYLTWLRLESPDFYDNVEYAANQCQEYREKKIAASKK